MDLILTDARRSLRLVQLTPLADIQNVVFYSLQKGAAAADAKYCWGDRLKLIDYTSRLNDFADTAAFILNLDLVITIDSSVAHLTGALGKPVWLLNRFDSCWRWMRNIEHSPWYPSMRLFRQSAAGQWAPVIEKVQAELRVAAQEFISRQAQIQGAIQQGLESPRVTAKNH